MAPPESHVVKRHAKITAEGVKYYVKTHHRKNRGKRIVLLPENILYLYWHGDQDSPRLGAIQGFPEFTEIDSVICFWNSTWQRAHFIPVVPGNFFYDYDKDGHEEVAIAVWHGGQSVESASAFIFNIAGDSLIFHKLEKVNYEFSRYVYEIK